MLTQQEKELIRQFNATQAFLEPFKRITDDWMVETSHKFQDRIRSIDLVASGDLEDDWSIKLIAHDTGVIVGEFTFPQHGRFHDMRKVDYTKPLPAGPFFDWIEEKIDKRQIKYSTLAQKNNLSFSDPRVIHDLVYRIIKSTKFNFKRRRWYNKGKEASLNDLYTQLQDAMKEAVLLGVEGDLTSSKRARRLSLSPA